MLWDMDHESYHSHQARRDKWAEIGRTFGISEMKAKKRFKSIRDEYRKESKRLSMGIQLSDRRMEWMESLAYLKNLRPRSRRPGFHMELAQLQEQSLNGSDQIQIKEEPIYNDDHDTTNGHQTFDGTDNSYDNGNSMDDDDEYPSFLPSLPPPPDEDMDCSYIPSNPLVPITILEHSPSPSPPPVPKPIPKIKISRSIPPLSLPEVSITIESPNQNGKAPPNNVRPSQSLLSTLKLKPKPLAALQPILPKPSPPPLIPSIQKTISMQPRNTLVNNTPPPPPPPSTSQASGTKQNSTKLQHEKATESNDKVTLGMFIDHMIEQEPEQSRERFNLEILDALVKIKRKFMEQRFSSANTK